MIHERKEKIAIDAPWFRGALFCYSKETIPQGMVIAEPYLFVTDNYGEYNEKWQTDHLPAFWQIVNQTYLGAGITDWVDVFCIPTWGYNRTESVGSAFIGDFPLGIEFQLFRGKVTNSYPSVKFYLQENFPTGKFNRLDPSKKGTQIGGLGSFLTQAGLVIGKLIRFSKDYWLNIALQYGLTIPARSHVKGLNTFGGVKTTNGFLYLGLLNQFDLGFQITFSQKWAFSCDILAGYYQKSKFKAITPTGYFDPSHPTKFSTALPSITTYSIAPTIEYSWSRSQGLVSAIWFSLPSRNTEAFISWVNAVELVF